ncbi:MAG: hypothetical protein Q8L39_16520 [Burkholderiales bacterium]|nr:hypothetical protein [Burkholderiales bacterium]
MLGIVVLGALGSGLWELIKPLLGWGWSAVLTIATLGIDSLRDEIYADTALAIGTSFQVTSTRQLLVGTVFLIGAMVISSIRLSFRPTTTYRLPLGNAVLLLVVATLQFVTAARSGYVSNLATYTQQLEIIAAPHVSESQIKQFRARGVQVKNRADYLANVEALRKVIEATGQKAPSRDFF